jgi:hypothetical protein
LYLTLFESDDIVRMRSKFGMRIRLRCGFDATSLAGSVFFDMGGQGIAIAEFGLRIAEYVSARGALKDFALIITYFRILSLILA